MAKDPYKLLGVPKSASDAEIRKAYRALAKKLHPDVNPNDEKAANRFKEITAAYTLLTDKKMRRQYDSGQVDGSGQQQNPFAGGGNPFGGFQRAAQSGQMGPGGVDDMSDLFASLFGMNMGGINRGRQTGGMNRGGYGQRTRPQAKRGSDIRVKMKLDFLDALKGGTKRLKIGTQSGVNVKIPAGVIDGAVIRLPGKGRPGTHGGRAGDAKVEITVKPHKYFSRDGQKLRLSLPITLQEAILGGKITIPMPSGDVSLKIPAGTNTGQTLRLKGKGLDGGDLYVSPVITLQNPKDKALLDWAKTGGSSEVIGSHGASLRKGLTR